ncbi:hypothetical protein BYT27DRAFT_6685932 [Phlegmacium glaucopus]|nr:hypothetical protein BYT27DRAFT_6685932 [Phlegmacium glaucopus]
MKLQNVTIRSHTFGGVLVLVSTALVYYIKKLYMCLSVIFFALYCDHFIQFYHMLESFDYVSYPTLWYKYGLRVYVALSEFQTF